MELHAEDGFKAQAARKGMARRRKMDGNSRSLVASLTRDHGGSGGRCLLGREEFFHDSQKILAGVAFRQDAVGAGGLNFVYGLIGVVDGEDQNFRSGGIAPYLTHGGKAIQDRHINVENDEIRVE